MTAPSPPPSEAPKGAFGSLVALVGAAAAAILVPTVQSWEGREHTAYRDIVGVLTICDGDTYNVREAQIASDAECDARLERQLISHAKPVINCTPSLKGRPNALAASVSLAYNIGPAAFCRSTAARHFRAGRWREGCDAFLSWRFAGGREIRGLKRRREAERQICLRGAA